jgi:methyl-accepting chemotaxis protein
MFPQSFTARVSQRMAIWGAMMGFLMLLFAASELIQEWKTEQLIVERQQATAAALSFFNNAPTGAGAHRERAKELITAIEAIDGRQADLKVTHRQNRILLTLLTLFAIGMILALEFRFLIKPVSHMAAVLRSDAAAGELAQYASRRDEIGAFAKALCAHFAMVAQRQDTLTAERERLSGQLEKQGELRRESVAFQESIAEVVRQLEDHATRMSNASENLATMSSDADTRAAASARSTERVSAHIDVVASSIEGIAQTLSSSAEDAEKTSALAAAARVVVDAAKDDAKALTEAARTTEDVRSGLQGITAASQRIAERVAKLVQSIDQVAAVAKAIAGQMREQDANSQAITSNTAHTAADVRNVATTVKDVAGMIGQTRQAADLVTKVSTDLGRQATDLRSAVDRFIETTQRTAA